ncbi:unnamed protein product [Effrenium voratum]|nr:unnamed protein product [Effrenium voratum]
MNGGTVVVVVLAAVCGAFVRAATGFGGSILFTLVYSVCGQFEIVPGLESAVLMVLLGTVFEMTTSPVLFAAVGRKALPLWRSQILLSALCLPGTILGSYLLVQTAENHETLDLVKTALNVLFYLVAVYKLTGEFRSVFAAPPSPEQVPEASHYQELKDEEPKMAEPEAPEEEDRRLCRQQGLQLVALGLGSGFLNGLVGLPGPLIMVYFASALSSGKISKQSSFVLTQSFFLVTTLMRLAPLVHNTETQELWLENWPLAAAIPLPALLALWRGWVEGKRFDTAGLLRSVLALLLLSSLMGLGLLEAKPLGLAALSLTIFWLALLSIRYSYYLRSQQLGEMPAKIEVDRKVPPGDVDRKDEAEAV